MSLEARFRHFLQWLLAKLESAPATDDGNDDKASLQRELLWLERQLKTLREDEETLGTMLDRSSDSFHHAVASSTAHIESNREKQAELTRRIKEVRSNLEK